MRDVYAGLETFLASTTTALVRHLVTLTPRTGSAVRWTDHATDLVLTRPARPNDSEASGDYTFTAGGTGTASLITIGDTEYATGLEILSCEVTLLCGDSALWSGTKLPLAAVNGAFDGAKVKVERVFGAAEPDMTLGAMHIWEGMVAPADPSSTAVTLTVESGLAELRVPLPRNMIQPGCGHVLFDAGCALTAATYTVTGTVSGGSTTGTGSNLTQANGWFDLGTITFTSGANNGATRAVRSYLQSSGAVTFDRPLSSAPADGDTFSIKPGCDKRLTTCETKYSNRAHFRGFVFVPRKLPTP
jgi:uncharacterized phage protein (TIGR02218 family)